MYFFSEFISHNFPFHHFQLKFLSSNKVAVFFREFLVLNMKNHIKTKLYAYQYRANIYSHYFRVSFLPNVFLGLHVATTRTNCGIEKKRGKTHQKYYHFEVAPKNRLQITTTTKITTKKYI